jgi:hypothetical protein
MSHKAGWASIIAAVLLLLLPDGGGQVVPVPAGDILRQCHVADRVSQVTILRQAATMPAQTIDDKRAVVKFVNDLRSTSRTKDWEPYTDIVGKSIDSGTLSQLADSLEGAK